MPSPAALRVSMMRSSQQNAGEAELIDAITAASAFVGDEPPSADTSLEDGGDDAEAYEELSDDEETDDQIMARISRERVARRTRSSYDSFIRKQARWAAANGFEDSVEFVRCGEMELAVGLKLPLSVVFVDKYLEYVENKKVPIAKYTQTTLPSLIEKNVSPSYFKVVCLAIFDLYINESEFMASNIQHLLRCRRLAYCRRVREMKGAKQYPLDSVHYCTFRGYEAINKKIIALRPDGNRGSWNIMLTLFPYVTLLWNMLSRCASIADLGWEHFSWSGDSMTIKVPGSKCDQAGIYAYAKRLYANTLKPWICPVVACALAFFCRKERSSKVFYCGDTVRNSLRHFREICSSFSPEECKELGCNLPTLAWHDFKRGGVSFLSSLTDAVNNVAVKIRADHRIVDISRCYVLETSGQDGLIGRLLSGLPYGEAEFANTCPHFTSTPGVDWETLVSDYKDFTPAFRDYVIPHFLATIAFHLPWLEENLPPNHPFLTGFGLVNRKMLQEVAGKVSGGKVVSKERRAAETGISAAVKTSIRVQQLESKVVDAVQSAVTAAVSRVLAQQCGGEAPASLVGAVSAAVQTAAAAVLHYDSASNMQPSVQHESSQPQPFPAALQGLPKGFQLSSLTLENVFNCWHIGRPFPYKLISKEHLRNVCSDALVLQRQATMLCRYRTCANAIENAAGVKVTADADNLKTVFLAGIGKLHADFNVDKDTSASYAYEMMRKHPVSAQPSVDAVQALEHVPAQHHVVNSVQERGFYGVRRKALEKENAKRQRLEQAAKVYDVAQLAAQPAIRRMEAASRARPTPAPLHNPDLPMHDDSDCDDAREWPVPSNFRIDIASRRCFKCNACNSWYRTKETLNQHGDRRHPPWTRVSHVRDVTVVMWCLRTGARGAYSPALHSPPPTNSTLQ